MKRIGIAASKISRGNLFLYNLNVVLISFFLSIFMFVIAGATIIFALVIIGYLGSEIMGYEYQKSQQSILVYCMTSLAVVVGVFNLMAIIRNVKVFKSKDE